MFTRLSYDEGTYNQDLYESTAPNSYMLLPESTHQGKNTCFQETPEIANGMGQYKISNNNNNMVSIESDLRNLQRKASEDPLTQYPYTQQQFDSVPSTGVCTHDNLEQRYEKLEGSQFNREKQIAIPRFESLCLNPQELNRIRSNNYIGTNTQLFFRDNKKQISNDMFSSAMPDPSNQFISPFMQKFSNLEQQQKEMKKEDKKIVENFSNSCSSCAKN